MSERRILDEIHDPHQLRRLSEQELSALAEELRAKIIETVSKQGGHLASNLGVAELTIALHYVFDFQTDRLLWDVGHQCYAHKLLTGRADKFSTLRQQNGLSGFPSPGESNYDLFATGHAGTAISTAVGLAWADCHAKRDTKVVAVVGDASIVNGLSLEGLNNAALLPRQFLIILNDNRMAIDRTRGALAGTLDRIRMTPKYTDLKRSTENLLAKIPLGQELGDALKHIKEGLRASLHGGHIFESLGFTYFGPVDGHDMHELIKILRKVGQLDRPVILHVRTQKGHGCQYAVEDPCRFHSTSAYKHHGDTATFSHKPNPTWTQTFADSLIALAAADERVVAITAAMADGTGLNKFREKFPDRFVDVGISESHAVAMAAGMAKAGLRPVVAVYSTFMQRAFDQVFQEVSFQKLPVILAMDRAGLVGSDGAVHHGFADIAMLRALPNMVLMAPADAAEMTESLKFALTLDCPSAIRYPRDEVCEPLEGPCPPFELGKGRLVKNGDDGTILCYGVIVEQALGAAQILADEDKRNVAVINARFAKPLDAVMLTRLISSADKKPLLICEEHSAIGGFGSAVMEFAASRGLAASNVRLMGMPDRYINHASRAEQLTEAGLDATNISAMMKDLIAQCSNKTAKNLR